MGKTPKTVRREPNGSGGQCMVGSCTLEAVGLREIAQILFISINTTKAHVANILQKLEVDDRLQAALKALRLDQ